MREGLASFQKILEGFLLMESYADEKGFDERVPLRGVPVAANLVQEAGCLRAFQKNGVA